jgi:hypothetical protein
LTEIIFSCQFFSAKFFPSANLNYAATNISCRIIVILPTYPILFQDNLLRYSVIEAKAAE